VRQIEVFLSVISGESNLHPAHASLYDLRRKIGNGVVIERSQTAQVQRRLAFTTPPVFAFRLVQQRRHPAVAIVVARVVQFRGSIPGLLVPLSTLHLRPCGRLKCMTRSQWVTNPSFTNTLPALTRALNR